MTNIWKRQIAIICTIVIIFCIIGHLYQEKQVENIRISLKEHAIIAAEPLWNFDILALENYFKVVSAKNHYSHIEIVDSSGESVFKLSNIQAPILKQQLSRIGLLPEITFKNNVVYDDKIIGEIVVDWIDNSIYFYGYTSFIAVLLYIIIQLYLSMLGARKSVEEQFNEVKYKKEYIEKLFYVIPEGLIALDKNNNAVRINKSFESIVENWANKRDIQFSKAQTEFVAELVKQSSLAGTGQYSLCKDNQTVMIEYTMADIPSSQDDSKLISIRDVTRLKSLERQLSQAQKLESVGRLASGIAHEINTPVQYVLTNINFIDEAFEDITEILVPVTQLTALDEGEETHTIKNEIQKRLIDTDWDYLKEEMPDAIYQAKEGLQRISSIILAMKDFSHPSGNTLEPHDINSAIEATVSVARNEWKYVAKLELNLDQSLPSIPCFLDELNQVVLIMIINSSHAIAEKYGEEEPLQGKIIIQTEMKKDNLHITFSDNGIGISEENKKKVFDHFFTTKIVGKGTGQGLAIAHDIIEKKHKGSIIVDSEAGKGTSFIVTIPAIQASSKVAQEI